jgi:hypothetical protein
MGIGLGGRRVEKHHEKIEAEVGRKLRKASQMLFFRRHRLPGVKGWELKRSLGKGYMKIIELLNSELEKIGMEVKIVFEKETSLKTPSEEDLSRARFYVVLKEPLVEKATGQRIDDLAALAASVAYIISRQGKVSRQELEDLLREKFPKWKVEVNLDRFIRQGYLGQEEDIVYLGWRARAEIDKKTLMRLLLS